MPELLICINAVGHLFLSLRCCLTEFWTVMLFGSWVSKLYMPPAFIFNPDWF